MSLTFRQRQDVAARGPSHPILGQVRIPSPTAGGGAAPPLPGTTTVRHGVHTGQYFISGMTVGQVRRTLGSSMNIDPDAVPVINGEQVEDEESRLITAEDRLLSFVKRGSIRGAGGWSPGSCR